MHPTAVLTRSSWMAPSGILFPVVTEWVKATAMVPEKGKETGLEKELARERVTGKAPGPVPHTQQLRSSKSVMQTGQILFSFSLSLLRT